MTVTKHQSSHESHLALLLSLCALGALGIVACSSGDDADDGATGAKLSPALEIERVGNEWARSSPAESDSASS